MTAIVGILNKRAVAIAADSASKICYFDGSNDDKVIYSAQKIFRICEPEPVAMMTYGIANFMTTPIDVAVSIYNRERGGRSFGKISEYCDDFLDFLRTYPLFSEPEARKYAFLDEAKTFYVQGQKIATKIAKMRSLRDGKSWENVYVEQMSSYFEFHASEKCPNVELEAFKDYSYDRFIEETGEWLETFFKETKEKDPLSEGIEDVFKKAFYRMVKAKTNTWSTGLVFAGYGKNDVFPSIHSVEVNGILDGKLRYSVTNHIEISVENVSEIASYAQDDVISTMVKGISSVIKDRIAFSLKFMFNGLKDKCIAQLKDAGAGDDMIKVINDIDTMDFGDEKAKEIDEIAEETYTKDILSAISAFGIKDMTEMAESLISITNLQRHFSNAEESVGGPVEVAVISLDKGFRWVKHRE